MLSCFGLLRCFEAQESLIRWVNQQPPWMIFVFTRMNWTMHELINDHERKKKEKSRIRWINNENSISREPRTIISSSTNQRNIQNFQSVRYDQWPRHSTYSSSSAMKLTFLRVPITILARVSHKMNRNNHDERQMQTTINFERKLWRIKR